MAWGRHLKISSFSDGGWGKYHRRLWRGFFLLEQWNVPLVIDLRSNAGGQSPRMESLWRHVAKEPLTLPHALVAKQSQATLAMHRKVYRGLRKRWVNKHRHQSEEATYIYDMANLALGEIDTLTFRKKSVASYHQKGPMALIMDGESASATVSFAGAFQATTRGPVLGEACMGPAQGTMGNPFLVRLPESGIHVSLSTPSTWPRTPMIGPPQKRFRRTSPSAPCGAAPMAWTKPFDCGRKSPPKPASDEVGLVDVLWGPLGVLAQFPVSESMRAAQDVSQALGLEAELAQHVLEAALPADRCLGHWQAQRDSLERATISEDALLEQVTAIQAAMKACRADRTAAMRGPSRFVAPPI